MSGLAALYALNLSKDKLVIINIIFDVFIFGVFIPVLYLVVSRAIETMFGFISLELVLLKICGTILIAFGSIMVGWAYYLLIQRGQGYTLEFFGCNLLPLTKKLVTSGPYAWSRHPMALGYLVALAGLGLVRGYVLSVIILLPFLFIATVLYLVVFEEKNLAKRFKQDFAEYKLNTGLIIPRLTRKG